MITAIATVVAKIVTGGLADKLLDLYKLRQDGKISEVQFESEKIKAIQDSTARISEAWAEATAKITESVQSTVRSSPVIQRAYAIVMFMQLFVLVWYQFGASAFKLATGVEWPAPIASIEWAYLLIAAMIGVGPFVYKK